MHEREELDALDKAVMSIDINYPAQQWDADRLGTVRDEHRHACCSECGKMGLVALDDGSKNKYECQGCGAKLKRASYRGPSGPNQIESRARRQRDIGECYLPNSGIKRLSRPARQWLEFAHTSICAADSAVYKKRFHNVRWLVYVEIAGNFEHDKKDDIRQIFVQLFALVELLIEHGRAGRRAPTNSDMAKHVGVDPSQFSAGRRWAGVADSITAIFQRWEDEIRNEIGGGDSLVNCPN
jgi:hypothetical protein